MVTRDRGFTAPILYSKFGGEKMSEARIFKSPAIDNSSYGIIVNLTQRMLLLYKGRQLIRHFLVGIGKPETPTPEGKFKITEISERRFPLRENEQKSEEKNPQLGDGWLEFHQKGLDSYGIHGTYNTKLLGKAESWGCVLMSNEGIKELMPLVSIGTPVVVRTNRAETSW